MKVSKNLTRLISLVFTVLLLVFAYRYISGIVQQADFGSLTINWWLVGLSGLLFCIYYGFLSLNWWLSGRILQPSVSRHQVLAFIASQPYKYLPTSVFTFSSRAVYGKRLGLTLKQGSVAQVFENFCLFAANFSLFAVLYLANIRLAYGIAIIIAGLLVLGGFQKVGNFNLRFKGRHLVVSVRHLTKMFFLSTAGWLSCGLAFVILNTALGFEVDFLSFLAANTIAFSLSILAVFAPGGIGVREVVYDFFSVSAAAIIYWRILGFVLDMILGVIAIALIKVRTKLTN